MSDGQAGRSQMRAEDRRDLLVQAALRVMKRDGVRAATTRAICAEAGMPHGAFHYCFHSKRDLYAALLSIDITTDLADAWEQIGFPTDVQAGINALLEAYWRTVEADPEAQIVLTELTTLALRDPELRELPRWEKHAYREQITGHLDRFARQARVHYTIPVDLLADMVLAALVGLTDTWLSHRDDASARRTLTEFATVFASFVDERSHATTD